MSHSRYTFVTLPGALSRAGDKVRSLRAAEFLMLVQAPVALPLAAYALRRWGLRRVLEHLSRRPSRVPRPVQAQAARATAERLGWCVQVTADHGPWPANCLQRSVVLWWFLRRRGLAGDLRIGVRRDPESGELDFHAWLEHEGIVINDRRDVAERYAMFARAVAPREAIFR